MPRGSPTSRGTTQLWSRRRRLSGERQVGEGGKNPMRQKLLVLVALLALVGGGSSARGADTKELEHVLDQWAPAWSSGDVERLLPLFTDSVDYEDVPFGAASHGRDSLRDIPTGTFAAFADLKFELKSRFVAAGTTVVTFTHGKISRNSDYWDLST